MEFNYTEIDNAKYKELRYAFIKQVEGYVVA